VFDRPRVVAQDGPFADAEPAALGDDDAARFERLGRLLDRLAAAGDAEIGVPRRQVFDDVIDAVLEIAAGDRGRIAAAKTAVGSTLYSAPMRARMWRASSRTSVRECTSTRSRPIGAPNVVKARER
jgi:hypothetical protein